MPDSVKRFKRAIRQRFEIFLRFTHRYWFHEISEQAAPRALFQMCADHLGLDPLYAEVKERIHDMDEYLDSDSLRRQANTVVRLTVVTTFGLIGTVSTGFLGMNLFSEADAPALEKAAHLRLHAGRNRLAHAVHDRQIETPLRLARRAIGRESAGATQARGAARCLARLKGVRSCLLRGATGKPDPSLSLLR